MEAEEVFQAGDVKWAAGDMPGALGAWERAYALFQDARSIRSRPPDH
jgi:hypothetical protein